MKYHIIGHRRLFFEGSSQKPEDEIVIRKTDRIKEARGLVKQETNSHLEMLDHHEYFDLHFDLIVSEDQMEQVIIGRDDEDVLRYQYTVKAIEND